MGWLGVDQPVSLITVYLGFYLAIVFLSLSIACGLYYLAELCEEYVMTTKRLIGHTIRAELLLHLLLFADKLPPAALGVGIVAHLSYLRLLKPFPYIQLTAGGTLVSIGLLLASTFLWIKHYMASYYTVEYIAAFLLLTTWLVPFAFFLGMSGDYTTLPGAGGWVPTPSGGVALQRTGSGRVLPAEKKRRGAVLRLFDMLRRKRDEVLPDIARQLPDASHLMKEKI
ncbi:Transmembrane adaptor Erv26 [Chlorella sorokiniana]|uniref:Transmembrane adaptor Erv26 n=1 Tax=Chlorella sorokiniana TaxID=3076 RepID=A0A2P6TRA2_CHLSO|nr:Transmembrane adaptor Erv26 [Chlorella sorokiniana]|eukprot:PRW56590.1 Transmembrane adaptor Erv26 [Chlorella sorokiniana]